MINLILNLNNLLKLKKLILFPFIDQINKIFNRQNNINFIVI